MLYLEERSFEGALDLYRQHDGKLDLVDSTNVTLMRLKGISRIASFDSDYDSFADIERIR